MLCTGGQTAGPIGLKFSMDTQGWPGSVEGKLFLNLQRRALQLVKTITNMLLRRTTIPNFKLFSEIKIIKEVLLN